MDSTKKSISSLPKCTFQRPKNYPIRNHGIPIKNWLTMLPPDNDYKPVEYISREVKKQSKPKGKADPLNPMDRLKHSYQSYFASIAFDENGRPLNPKYRTGITNRGNLYHWGANFAADALVTRENNAGNFEILLIQRKDAKGWALPGGFLEPSENPKKAGLRELKEETHLDLSRHKNGKQIYQGYVDDPRTTDNAWIETTVVHYHLKRNHEYKIKKSKEIKAVRWKSMTDKNLSKLYANHGDIAKKALKSLIHS